MLGGSSIALPATAWITQLDQPLIQKPTGGLELLLDIYGRVLFLCHLTHLRSMLCSLLSVHVITCIYFTTNIQSFAMSRCMLFCVIQASRCATCAQKRTTSAALNSPLKHVTKHQCVLKTFQAAIDLVLRLKQTDKSSEKSMFSHLRACAGCVIDSRQTSPHRRLPACIRCTSRSFGYEPSS